MTTNSGSPWPALIIMGLMFLGIFGIYWYNAGVKQRAWAREGSALTQWEVFCGATPLERVFK